MLSESAVWTEQLGSDINRHTCVIWAPVQHVRSDSLTSIFSSWRRRAFFSVVTVSSELCFKTNVCVSVCRRFSSSSPVGDEGRCDSWLLSLLSSASRSLTRDASCATCLDNSSRTARSSWSNRYSLGLAFRKSQFSPQCVPLQWQYLTLSTPN